MMKKTFLTISMTMVSLLSYAASAPDTKAMAGDTPDTLAMLGGTPADAPLLRQWEQQAAPVRMHAWQYLTARGGQTVGIAPFKAERRQLQQLATQLLPQLQDDTPFAHLMRLKMDAELMASALCYVQNHYDAVDSIKLTTDEERRADEVFQSADLLRLPFAADMLVAYVNHKAATAPATLRSARRDTSLAKNPAPAALTPESTDTIDYAARAALLPTAPLQAVYLCEMARRQHYYEKYLLVRQAMADSLLTPAVVAELQAVEQELAWSKPGQQAIDFKGETLDGGELSLSQLKGKVVVIDAWATWCAPCLRLMPAVKELERELNSPDLVFLSVCIGVSVEKDLWHKLCAKHDLHDNVIFADGWTRGFARDYHITGVPRFMIIDRQGRVASYAAPSPKYAALKTLIENTLKIY